MIELLNDLFLISARGLTREALIEMRGLAKNAKESFFAKPSDLSLLMGGRTSRNNKKAIVWPRRRSVESHARRLIERKIQIVWIGESLYPKKLSEEFGDDAPPYVLVEGNPSRLQMKQCAMIGSRQSPSELCDAARLLAQELCDRGIVVTSGMAEGADAAAHDGAVQGKAGSVGVPARGLLMLNAEGRSRAGEAMTILGLGRPDENFHAGLAIRRNDVVAAMSEGLVLVASGLKGGSAYALRWAMGHGRPIWCFENGRKTPSGNASLLKAGLARPLRMNGSPAEWGKQIAAGIEKYSKGHKTRYRIRELNFQD